MIGAPGAPTGTVKLDGGVTYKEGVPVLIPPPYVKAR